MVRAVERIEQDLVALEEAITLVEKDFHNVYFNYLTLLGQIVRRQLMLVSYQVCTQGYPEAFLSLSFNQRQQLQQTLKQLGKKAEAQLLSSLEPSTNSSATPEEEPSEPTSEPSLFISESLQPTPQETSQSPELVKNEVTMPRELLEWQENLEDAIAQTLQEISVETNHTLQQEGIIPDKLPATALEAVTKAGSSGETSTGAANLLNLLIETKNEDDAEDSTLTRIVAINLRLSEIEFAESALTAGRNQIRTFVAKVSKLAREHRKIKRERAVAQAEAAWRSSWFED
ncbi:MULTISPECIES: hypothetical protein [unclassified Coleofasciculus]|uniref:hypothetical protein n=1 Tax=unclassified Coleofasciculus TaxID=2692782 RepID=UPI001881D4AE|nr:MULTISPECIES: hypothetical protein [unclassified Coleofasciculus]MBE9129101.1 hypothetical protein [Coleofasciculus sp. LEGE 07081]MBE9151785.1 hypothetical protein [Coleofasciculus sp. LEGE 07092]